jgi:hypothetical protein
MTVVLSHDQPMYPDNPVCTVCGDKQYHPPPPLPVRVGHLLTARRCGRAPTFVSTIRA